MNPRLIKEIRVVMPAFALTLSASVVPPLIGLRDPEGWMFFLFTVGCLFMGALVFGSEFQQGTMNLLLIQPVRRTSIWKEKMRVLGAALAIGTAVLSTALLPADAGKFLELDAPWMGLVLIPLCAFCATPLFTLLYRGVLAGAFAGFFVPVLILGVNAFLHRHHPAGEEIIDIVLIMMYCVASCWLGYRQFARLQVADAHSMRVSRELGIPARLEGVLLRPFRAISAGFTGVFATLVKKELRLQQISFMAALLFCAVVVMESILTAWRYDPGSEEHWPMVVWIGTFYIYLSILPLIAGAVSVAEEKAWGVADWQITLPPSVPKQWTTKILVALFTSLVLGLLLPAALALGLMVLHGWTGELGRFLVTPGILIMTFLLGHLLITSVVIYAAGLTGNTARGILLAFGMFMIAGLLMKLAARFLWHFQELGMPSVGLLWRDQPEAGPMGLSAGFLMLLCLIHRFAYVCYRERRLSRLQLTVQSLVLALSVLSLTIGFLALVGFGRP